MPRGCFSRPVLPPDRAQDSGVALINSALWFNEMLPLACSWERGLQQRSEVLHVEGVCLWGVGVGGRPGLCAD